MKEKMEVIKQLVISDELDFSLVKKVKGSETYFLVLSTKDWEKSIPLAQDLGKAALSFVTLSDKLKTKYEHLGLKKFKNSIEKVESTKLSKQQEQLLYEILTNGASRVLH